MIVWRTGNWAWSIVRQFQYEQPMQEAVLQLIEVQLAQEEVTNRLWAEMKMRNSMPAAIMRSCRHSTG